MGRNVSSKIVFFVPMNPCGNFLPISVEADKLLFLKSDHRGERKRERERESKCRKCQEIRKSGREPLWEEEKASHIPT